MLGVFGPAGEEDLDVILERLLGVEVTPWVAADLDFAVLDGDDGLRVPLIALGVFAEKNLPAIQVLAVEERLEAFVLAGTNEALHRRNAQRGGDEEQTTVFQIHGTRPRKIR